MQILVMDLESYYDSEYSLKKLTPPQYILDNRWETILLTVKDITNGLDKPAIWLDGPHVGAYLKSLKAELTATVTFNALFDNCALAWRYGFVPGLMLDAMGMARALRGHLMHAGASLKAVAELLGVGVKGDEIVRAMGKHRADLMRDGQWDAYVRYGLNDTEITARIFERLLPSFPYSERSVMDRVLRAAVVPRLKINTELLTHHLMDVRREKEMAILQSGVGKDDLMSTPKFKAALEAVGVKVETKISATGKEIPALAKTDEFMQSLQEHEDTRVQALACARLGVKSTIEETRGTRLLEIGQLPWDVYCGSKNLLPVPLAYGRAHTHRLAGDWKLNMQNLPSGRNAPSKLRQSVEAPYGSKLVVADFRQIEARVTAWICRQMDLVAEFEEADRLEKAGDKNPPDPYKALASLIFNFNVTDKKSMERFIGKTGVLGLGYRCGARKFHSMVESSARLLGADLTKVGNAGWTEDLAQHAVDIYRTKNKEIVNMWYALDRILSNTWGVKGSVPWKLERDMDDNCVLEVGYGYILFPNNIRMNYIPIGTDDDGQLIYKYGKFVRTIHGGSFLENIVQCLSRIIVTNAMLRLWDRGLQFVLQAHDELVFVVPDAEVTAAVSTIREEFCRRPGWGPKLPMGVDVGVGQNYGEAK